MTLSQSYWQFRWHGLVLAWCVSIVGWIGIAIQPDAFLAISQIYVKDGSSFGLVTQDAASGSPTVTASDLVRKSVLDKQELDSVLQAAQRSGRTHTGEDVLARIEISASAAWDNLFRISFSDGDRNTALSIVEAFVSVLRERAALETDIDGSSATRADASSEPFRVIEPVTVVTEASPANPLLWITSLLAGSLGVGVTLIALLGRRRPVFDSADEVAAMPGLVVATAIAHARLPEAKIQRRREFVLFVCAAAALIITSALILLFERIAGTG